MGAMKTIFIVLAVCLVWAMPSLAAEVKVLDELDKTIFTDAIKERCARYQQASQELQKSLDELNSGEEISSIFRMNKALTQVAESEKLLAKASGELTELSGYVALNREKLVAAGLEMFLPLVKLNDMTYRQYQEAMKAYFAAFNAMLEYSKANISALRVGMKAETEKHESLYNGYVAATDRQGEAYGLWSQFLFQFYQDYPLLRPYLQKKSDPEEKS